MIICSSVNVVLVVREQSHCAEITERGRYQIKAWTKLSTSVADCIAELSECDTHVILV